MATVVISEFMDASSVSAIASRVSTHYEDDLVDRPHALHHELADARALIVRNRTRVDATLLDAAPKLEVVGRLGVGLDNIDLKECASRGVSVRPATGANDDAVAEYVAAAVLLLLRPAFLRTSSVISGSWPRSESVGHEVSGKTAGLIGFGGTARTAAHRLSGLGMHILGYDPAVDGNAMGVLGFTSTTLERLLRESDVVSIHVPLNDRTWHLVAANEIAEMKKGAVLINAARGGIVDEKALCAALSSGHLGGAALDVFETEPLTADAASEFRDTPNLIMTPHIAGVTTESNERVSALISAVILDALGVS